MKLQYQKGQSLIETVAALGIISVIISAIGVLVTTSLSNAKYNQYQTLATKYAQQGIEIAQQIRDSSYKGFKNNYHSPGMYCLGDGATTLGTNVSSCAQNVYNIGPNYVFKRYVTIAQDDGTCGVGFAHVTVFVEFTDGKCTGGSFCHIVKNDTCLSTVDPVPAP